jgi:PsbP-like protein
MIVFSLLTFFSLSIIAITLYILPSQQQQQQLAMAQQTNTTTIPSQANATTPTGNFLTYDNATLGFKMQYPSNWENFQQQNTVLFISPFRNDSDRYRETVAVSFIPFANNVSLDRYVSNTTTLLNTTTNDFELYLSTPTSLAGLPAHMLEYTYSDPFIGITRAMVLSILEDDKYVYTITYYAKPAEYENSLATAQRMIDSFQPYTPPL